MDAQDDAVQWVRERFNDPTYYLDAEVLAHIERNPGFAEVLREMITRPPAGLRYRVDISPPQDPDLATEKALERLNARLRLIGVHAVSYEGEQGAKQRCLWTVRVPQSHVEYVQFTLTGPYGTSSGPDREALATEVEELSLSQLDALRRCFGETLEHIRAGLARLQGEDLPESRASPPGMLHYLVHQEVQSMGGHLLHLEYMDGIVAREQQRRSTRPDMGPSPQ